MSAGSSKLLSKKVQPRIETDEESWENHLIIRFPSDVAPVVSQIVEDEAHANDRLAMNFDPDCRSGTFRVDKSVMPFKIQDLPTVTEVMKTLDKKTLYKVADLSQIVICSPSNQLQAALAAKKQLAEASTSANSETSKKEGHHYPHGLAPPMKNARKCRFRKTKKKKYMDAPDVERELKRLLSFCSQSCKLWFRSDLEAHAIRWEVVPVADADKQKDVQHHGGSAEMNRPNVNILGLEEPLSDSDEESN